MKLTEKPEGNFEGMTRRLFIKALGGLAGLSVLGSVGCSHKKKKPVTVLPKPKPIITIKYKDKNLNGRFDPWIDDRIGEDAFYREGENLVIYIVPENVKTGDVLDYSITGPVGTVIFKNSLTLASDDGYVKIDGLGTNTTEYFVAQGGYGTYTIHASLNGKILVPGGKEFKISPRPRG